MTRFRRNRRMNEQLRREPAWTIGLARVAKPARDNASRFARAAGAPWMRRGNEPTVDIDTDDGRVYIVNTDHGGHLMEFGSRNNPPHAPLRRGARLAGLRLDEDN